MMRSENNIVRYMGRVVGIVKGKRFITWKNHRHFFRKHNGFGESYAVLETIRKRGCTEVVIIYTKEDGSQVKYVATPEDFIDKGVIHREGERDYQRILNILYMKKGGE